MKEANRFNLIYSVIAMFLPGMMMGFLKLDGVGMNRLFEKSPVFVWSLLLGLIVLGFSGKIMKHKATFNTRLTVYVILCVLLFNVITFLQDGAFHTITTLKGLLTGKPDAVDISVQVASLLSCLLTVFIFKKKYAPVTQ